MGRYAEMPGDHFTAKQSPEFEEALAGLLAEQLPNFARQRDRCRHHRTGRLYANRTRADASTSRP
jgi:hypothetical protein